MITGTGTIDGRNVAVFSQDATVFGGSLGEVYGEKIVKVMDFALKTGIPMIGINDGGGARIQEGVVALGLYGEIFMRNVRSSGVIPQISLIMGAVRGRRGVLPRDHRLHGDGGRHQQHVHHRPGRDQDGHRRGRRDGGPRRRPGAQHEVRRGALPGRGRDRRAVVRQGAAELPAQQQPLRAASFPAREPIAGSIADSLDDTDLELDTVIPDSPNPPYDMHEVITRVLDEGEFLEVQALWAPNIVVGFGRVEGRSVGVVANQPTQFAGCLDIDASEKASRFVRTCDAFNIPVLTFVDVPGFLPGTEQEWNGIIRRGAKLIYAYCEATVPKVTVITRKAYGGAYDVMGSKHLGADVNVAWPTAQIAVTGSAGAVSILYRKELKDLTGDELAAKRAELQQHYEDTLANPYIAADRGYIDAVIPPSHTRGYVGRALRTLATKRAAAPMRKHGNIPL